jgi:nucleoside-diphosphate-sugar epimerase
LDVLQARGHTTVAISRSRGVDLISGKGLAEALVGVDCVIDVASGPSPDQEAATRFFTIASRNLQDAAARAGVRQIVAVSIIGIDQFSAGYMVAKVAHERALQGGPVPARILRAAQFHEFVGALMDWGRQGDVTRVPNMRTQLVAAKTVAEALADLAEQGPPAFGGHARNLELAGPRAENLVDAARMLAARLADPSRVEGVTNPDDPDRDLYAAGALLPGPGATLAGPSFEQWLGSRDFEDWRASK